MKRTPTKTEQTDLKVWCDRCRIRIAPNEERVEADSRWYHLRCRPRPLRAVKSA